MEQGLPDHPLLEWRTPFRPYHDRLKRPGSPRGSTWARHAFEFRYRSALFQQFWESDVRSASTTPARLDWKTVQLLRPVPASCSRWSNSSMGDYRD
jgi:hypothetical protein